MAVLTPRKWTWEQSGAPVVDSPAGTLVSLLKATIVGNSEGKAFDGQDSCGWTILLDTANRLVIRGSTTYGFGTVVDIDDSTASAATIRVGEGWNGSAVTNIANSSTMYMHHGTVSGVPRRWIVIADERTVYIAVRTSSSTEETYPLGPIGSYTNPYWNLTIFGDMVRFDGNPTAFVAGRAAATGASTSTLIQSNFSSTPVPIWTSRNSINGISPTAVKLCMPGYTGNAGTACWGQQDPGAASATYAPFRSTGDFTLWSNQSIIFEQTAGSPMGYIRGLYTPLSCVIGLPGCYPGAVVKQASSLMFSELTMILLVANSGTSISYATWGVLGIESKRGWDRV